MIQAHLFRVGWYDHLFASCPPSEGAREVREVRVVAENHAPNRWAKAVNIV